MTLLARYVYMETARYFAIVVSAVVGIYLTVDFIEKVDDFIEAGAPVARAFVYLAYKLPFIIAQITPIGVLLSVLITFGLMSKHNELLALRTSGISTTALLNPTLKFAAVIAFILLFVSESLAPFSTMQANHIWLTEVKKENIVSSRKQDIWMKTDRAIVNFQYYHSETATAQGISLNLFNDHFQLVHRLDAVSGKFENGRWIMQQVVEQFWRDEGDGYEVKVHPECVFDLNLSPDDLRTVARQSSEMSFLELYHFIQNIEKDGYDATTAKVDLQSKIAFPFTCFIMAFIGLGVAARGRIREGLVAGIVYGLGIVFLYWIFFSFCISLGYGGLIPPFLAAWLAGFVFTCIGWVIISYAQ